LMTALGRIATLAGILPLAIVLAGCPSTGSTPAGATTEVAAASGAVFGLPGANDIWRINDPSATAEIDHSAWDEFLHTYLSEAPNGVNRIDYEQVSDQDRQKLEAYLAGLNEIKISQYNRDQQIGSIMQVRGPGINIAGPWLNPIARVEGHRVSFNDVEHHILRAWFNDGPLPIHYGVNCASAGCPPLCPRAHTAQNWRDNLEAMARQYINSGQAFKDEDGHLTDSKIYHSWFKGDFGGTDQAVIEHLLRYADSDHAQLLKSVTTIEDDFYDWRINRPDHDS